MKFQINRKDTHGYIITGYQQLVIANTKEEAVFDYLNWLDDGTVNEENLDIEEIHD